MTGSRSTDTLKLRRIGVWSLEEKVMSFWAKVDRSAGPDGCWTAGNKHAPKTARQLRAAVNAVLKAPVSETSTRDELEAKLLNVLRLADELMSAVDNEAEDIGGQRSSGVILRELGPAVDAANAAVKEAAKEIEHG